MDRELAARREAPTLRKRDSLSRGINVFSACAISSHAGPYPLFHSGLLFTWARKSASSFWRFATRFLSSKPPCIPDNALIEFSIPKIWLAACRDCSSPCEEYFFSTLNRRFKVFNRRGR